MQTGFSRGLLAIVAIIAIWPQPAAALEIKRSTLSNGAVLLVSEQHQLPMVTIAIAFDAGARRDPKGKEGLAALTAQSIDQGTATGQVQWFQRNVDMKRLKNYKYPDGTFVNLNLNRPSSTTGEITNFNPLYWNNPYFEVYENPTNDSRDRFFGNIGLTYQLFTGLKVSGFVRSDMYTQSIEEKSAGTFIADGKVKFKFSSAGKSILRQSEGQSELLVSVVFQGRAAKIVEEIIW